MGAKIEAGCAWLESKHKLFPGPASNGRHLYDVEGPANGVVFQKAYGTDFEMRYLVHRDELGYVTVITDTFATILGVKGEIPLDVSTQGQVMQREKTFTLIGHSATIRLGQEGDPNYLKVTNQVEFRGDKVSS